MNDFHADILADSISPLGYRLTTFEITFPRFILAEFNTHRVFSRNSASSRAIPIHKQIERVIHSPFVPLGFGSAQKGMSAGDDLAGWKAWVARQIWLNARWPSAGAAKLLEKLDVHKSFANRLLEPWLWHTVIVTATEWDNFFALRTDEGAQPEIRKIAGMMQAAYWWSRPKTLGIGETHLPLVFPEDKQALSILEQFYLSAGRCARVSFDRQHDSEGYKKSLDRAKMLTSSGHWSPTEHQAMVSKELESHLSGNFQGDWIQWRKTFDHEDSYAKLKAA